MRDSVTQPGCWALSVRVPVHVNCVGITHYLIQHSKRGVKLKVCRYGNILTTFKDLVVLLYLTYLSSPQGLDKEWPSLEALITHLTVIPEMLPCPLRLPDSCYGPSSQRHPHHRSTSNPTFTEDEEAVGGREGGDEEEEDEDDAEYQRLSDFSSMMADMQLLATTTTATTTHQHQQQLFW